MKPIKLRGWPKYLAILDDAWEGDPEEEFMPVKNLTQCLLVSDDGSSSLVCWIQQELAKKGKRVKSEDKSIPGIFKVQEVYTTMDEKSVIENSQDYRRTRKFSDI